MATPSGRVLQPGHEVMFVGKPPPLTVGCRHPPVQTPLYNTPQESDERKEACWLPGWNPPDASSPTCRSATLPNSHTPTFLKPKTHRVPAMYNTYTCALHTHIDIAASRLRYALFLKKKNACFFSLTEPASLRWVASTRKRCPPKGFPTDGLPSRSCRPRCRTGGSLSSSEAGCDKDGKDETRL